MKRQKVLTMKNGQRVRLVRMEDDQAPPKGTLGTVQYIDDLGTIHVRWDTGSCLGLIPEIDDWEIL